VYIITRAIFQIFSTFFKEINNMPRLRGESINNSKLKEADILEIKKLSDQGYAGTTIAKIYGVDSSAITAILRGKTWKHIPREYKQKKPIIKFSEEQLLEIIGATKNKTYKQVAEQFGITIPYIVDLLHKSDIYKFNLGTNYECTLKRFWENVVKKEGDQCWEWLGKKSGPDGRSRFSTSLYPAEAAARIMYRLVKGNIPEGLFVCHHCDNPGCMNPDHLFLGTHQDNTDDMVSKNRQAMGVRNKRTKYTEKEIKKVIALLQTNKTYKKISLLSNVSIGTVSSLASGITWKSIKRAKISRCYKVTKEEKDKIVELRTQGYKYKEISAVLNITVPSIAHTYRKYLKEI